MRVPQWRFEPQPVRIICQIIRDGENPSELIVQFKINGDEYTAFVPKQYVNQRNSTLAGLIVADYEDSWLIDLPVETLTSGSRIRVPDAEKKSVILSAA